MGYMRKTTHTPGSGSREESGFKTFEDLEAYRVAREFRKAMYGVARRLPSFEKYELGSQIRSAAVSLTNNIAEGHGRFHHLDQIRFMLQARGSLEELQDDLNVCEDETYLEPAEISRLKEQGWHVLRLLNGYIRWLRDRKTGQSLELKDDTVPYGDTDDELEAWLASLPL
jgi:four helix bundle protein